MDTKAPTDEKILDDIYNWAAGYRERLTPRQVEERTYLDAVDEVLALMADRAWVDSEGLPIEPDEELAPQ